MNNNDVNNVNNNNQPKKKSNAWIIVLCIVIGCIVLIPALLVGLVMLIAMLFVPKGIDIYNDIAENRPEISIHVDDGDKEADIHIGGNTNDKEPEKKEDGLKYFDIVQDTFIYDEEKLADTLMKRYMDSMYPTDCKSALSDFIGKTGTIKPNVLSEKEASKYIFNLFVILHETELTYEKSSPLKDNYNFESILKFTKEDYIKYGKILFGENYNAKIVDDGGARCISFKYDKANSQYDIIIPGGCGGTCSPETYFLYKLSDAKKEGNKFNVYYRVVYRNYNPNTDEILYFANKEKTIPLTLDENNEPNYDKGELYVVEFEKNGAAYSFVKSYKK